MNKFNKVIILEVECALDKSKETVGGQYRRDTPWLVEAFKKKGVEADIIFITNKDTADSLVSQYPDTAFLGRVNPMDYPGVLSLNEYIDGILSGLNKKGVLLGPILEHMDRLGSKMVVYELRDTTMGIDAVRLHSHEDMQKNCGEIDRILAKDDPARVLKMMRGSTGLGVWKLENKGDNIIIVTDAYDMTTEDLPRDEVLPKFCKLCQEDAISMPFLPLIKDGEFRFLLTKCKVLDIIHKMPTEEAGFSATLRSGAIYKSLDLEENRAMVTAVEKWAKDIMGLMNLETSPYWWSIDSIEADDCTDKQIPSSTPGRHLVLSEINCSCLGLVSDTSEDAKERGMRFADLIADICLSGLDDDKSLEGN